MKYILLWVFTLHLFTASTAQYWQPQQQHTGFNAWHRGVSQIDVVDNQCVWITAFDGNRQPGHTPTTILEYALTLDGGNHWQPAAFTDDTTFWAFAQFEGVSATHAWALMYNKTGFGAKCYRTTNGGQSWENRNPFGQESFPNVIHFFNTSEGFAMGDPVNGVFEIFTTDNFGTTWNKVSANKIPTPKPLEYGLTSAVGYHDEVVAFGTTKSRIFLSTDKGKNWTAKDLSPVIGSNRDIFCIAMQSETDMMVLYAGNGYTDIAVTHNGGQTWQKLPQNDLVKNPIHLAHVPESDRFVVCGGNSYGPTGSAYSDNYGQSWTIVDTLLHLNTAWASVSQGWSGGFTQYYNNVSTGGMYVWLESTGISQSDFQNPMFHLQPNPVSDLLYLKWEELPVENTYLSVMNMMGEVVMETLYDGQSPLDVSVLPAGIYILGVQTRQRYFQQKFIKLGQTFF